MTAYESAVAVAKTYMGPAAESLMARQCQVGLGISPADITKAHLKDLAGWVEIAACRFIEHGKAVDMAKRIAAL
jgi:hypothetical protein